MKRILLMAAIATSLFACSKSETEKGSDPTTQKEVSISINQASKPVLKGVSDKKTAGEHAVIGSAFIYFLDAENNNVLYRELTTAEVAVVANTASTSTTGNAIKISGVPSSAVSLYFVANTQTTDGAGFPIIDDIGTITSNLRIDRLQADAKHVPMAGLSGAFIVGAAANTFTASVTLTPLVARLEVGKLTYVNENGASAPLMPSDYTKYKLSGLYINDIYKSVLLGGKPSLSGPKLDIRLQGAWMDDQSWPLFFGSANDKFPYYQGATPVVPAGWVANSMVTHCTPSNLGLVFYPNLTTGSSTVAPSPTTENNVWGYQICPSTTVGVGAPADVPHLILKLTEVELEGGLGLVNPTQYITIEKYKDNLGDPILEFKRGNVYSISSLEFTHTQASEKPYVTNISVEVTVTVEPWVINEITPDF